MEAAKPGDIASRLFDVVIVTVIALNVIAVVMGSVPSIQLRWGKYLEVFERVSVLLFSLEYIARLWSCTADPRFAGAIRGRLRCALSPMVIIDLLAILPFYVPFITGDLRALRVLRMLRIFRVFKLGRYWSSLMVIRDAIRAKKEELILTLVMMMLLLVVAATLLYYCENEAQPNAFSSIPAAMWWAIATLTTVGYGDIYPITVPGRLLGGVVAIMGILMFALPTGILGAAFVEAVQKKKQSPRRCPHCGKLLS